MLLPKVTTLQHSELSVTGVTAVSLRHAALLYVNIAAPRHSSHASTSPTSHSRGRGCLSQKHNHLLSLNRWIVVCLVHILNFRYLLDIYNSRCIHIANYFTVHFQFIYLPSLRQPDNYNLFNDFVQNINFHVGASHQNCLL